MTYYRQQGYNFIRFIPILKIPSLKIWLFLCSEWLFCVQGLTCGQWGCKQLKGGWNSKPGTESWSDTSGLNSSPPLSAGPPRLCNVRKTERKLERWTEEKEEKGWLNRSNVEKDKYCYDDILNHFPIIEKLTLFWASVGFFFLSETVFLTGRIQVYDNNFSD